MPVSGHPESGPGAAPHGRGVLVLVVGPSGAGKDSLLRIAGTRLQGDARFVFIRRIVTRASDPATEEIESVGEREFAARALEGGFALDWQAHGLRYGLPRAPVEDGLRRGCCVVANASRTIIDEARARYPNVAVALVTAAPATLARRLAERRRESIEDIERRIARADALAAGKVDATICNDGSLADAAERFHAVLVAFADARPAFAERQPGRRASG